MAFPLPQHLPRAGPLGDVHDGYATQQPSTAQRILRDVAKPLPQLSSAVARKCVEELNRAITDTKKLLYSHIKKDPVAFDHHRRLAEDLSNQTSKLSNEVRDLDERLSDANAGLLPVLLKRLATHKTVAQSQSDAFCRTKALDTFLTSFAQLETVATKTREGDLPSASQVCQNLSEVLSRADREGLFPGSKLWSELLARFRATDDSIQEQLGKAYHNAVHVAVNARETTLRLQHSVKLPGWTRTLELSAIVSAMRTGTVDAIAASLRKDIMSRVFEPVQTMSAAVFVNADTLTISPESTASGSILFNLERILDFLKTRLPMPIMASLRLDVSSSLLKHVIIPSMPQSLPALPPFLKLLHEAVELEKKFGNTATIKEWADDVGLHYERARRQALLDQARGIILDGVARYFEAEETSEAPEAVLPHKSQVPMARPASTAPSVSHQEDDQSSWDFDDAQSSLSTDNPPSAPDQSDESAETETWDFEEPKMQAVPDDSANWGWEDGTTNNENVEDEDDPWDLPAPPPKTNGQSAPRAASKLEKRANRGRQAATNSEEVSLQPARDKQPPRQAPQAPAREKPVEHPSVQYAGKRTYTVSQHAQAVLDVGRTCLEESKQLLVHPEIPKRHPPTGTLLMSTSSSLFDLYRALPQEDVASPRYVIVSNDCRYLAKEVEKLAAHLSSHNDATKLPEVVRKLDGTSTRALIMSTSQQIRRIQEALIPAAGFADTANDASAVKCHRAVESVLARCQTLSKEWQPLMTFANYAKVMGAVVDSALRSIMEAILRLPDITETESHRLSALCVMMHRVEELFVKAPGMTSDIALYVPSWFKFNYLSTLLEASMADFKEFFTEGMLVDFDVQEIASLLRALFADTPKRAETVDMVLAGHPGPRNA